MLDFLFLFVSTALILFIASGREFAFRGKDIDSDFMLYHVFMPMQLLWIFLNLADVWQPLTTPWLRRDLAMTGIPFGDIQESLAAPSRVRRFGPLIIAIFIETVTLSYRWILTQPSDLFHRAFYFINELLICLIHLLLCYAVIFKQMALVFTYGPKRGFSFGMIELIFMLIVILFSYQASHLIHNMGAQVIAPFLLTPFALAFILAMLNYLRSSRQDAEGAFYDFEEDLAGD
jgi:hypothetical protein